MDRVQISSYKGRLSQYKDNMKIILKSVDAIFLYVHNGGSTIQQWNDETMNKKLSLNMLKAHHACGRGRSDFVNAATYIDRTFPADLVGGREFEAVDLLEASRKAKCLDTAHLLWVTPLICTPAEVIGLAQDIAQIAVDELQILCEKYDTEPTEFDWVRDYVRNPDRRTNRQMWRQCSKLELLLCDGFGLGDLEQLTNALNLFAEIVSELQGDDQFVYGGADCFCYPEDCDCERVEFKNFADELRGHTENIEIMIDNVDCFSERTLTKEINAAFVTAFTPAHNKGK